MDGVSTLATIPAILALTNLLKSFGVEGRWSMLVAVILGLSIVSAETLLPSDISQMLARGILLGLGAAGLYDVVPGSASPLPERAEE